MHNMSTLVTVFLRCYYSSTDHGMQKEIRMNNVSVQSISNEQRVAAVRPFIVKGRNLCNGCIISNILYVFSAEIEFR